MSDNETPLHEGKDYYMENGYLVFTAEYHRKRGYCCGSGCRHCPWREEKMESAGVQRREDPSLRLLGTLNQVRDFAGLFGGLSMEGCQVRLQRGIRRM